MVSSFGFFRYCLRLIKHPLYKLRRNLVHISSEVDTGTYMRDSNIGRYCYIGRNCVLNSVDIGNYSCIASCVQIGGMEHSIKELSISPTLMGEKCVLGQRTYIGHDVWIAANCIIKQGVRIGDGAVIGANSFVNKDVEPYAIVFGSPAKFHKYRQCKSLQAELEKSNYWNCEPEKAKRILENLQKNHLPLNGNDY